MLSLCLKNCTMKITEDNNNIYIDDYTIPKGREKEDIKTKKELLRNAH